MICLTPSLYIFCSSSSRILNKMATFLMKKLLLGCMFSFDASAKNVRQSATKCCAL